MSDYISRQQAIKDAESWVAVDEYEKHLQKNVVEWLKEFPSAEHGTNLAEVGTDLISRQAAITALTFAKETGIMKCGELKGVIEVLNRLPSAGQRRGRWMSLPHKRARICSWCEHDEPYKFADDNAQVFNFCPNCGADMRGE